jgi:quinol-cytochrome oxidoreductase complex cytochrome b subunit
VTGVKGHCLTLACRSEIAPEQALFVGDGHGTGRPSRVTNERPWVVATRVMLAIVGVLIAVLVITGVMLVLGYRPDVTAANGITSHLRTRTIHRVASQLLFPAFGGVAVAAAGLALVRHRAARLVAPIVAGLAVFAASITGYLLPWDQLAVTHVAVGSHMDGYRAILFHDNVRFVLIGNSEISTSTLARWVWIHMIGVTPLLVVLLVVVALQTRTTNPRSIPSSQTQN